MTVTAPLHRAALLASLAALTACGGGGGDAAPAPAPTPPAAPAPQVTLTVSNGAGVAGNIVITLEPTATPVTVANFLQYVNSGFYNGTVFHRHGRSATGGAPATFVLQGGGFAGPLTSTASFGLPKTTLAPIALEVGRGLSNVRYTVAMARTNVLNSATSQFFINTTDNVFLDTSAGGYAVFGTVTAGREVVDAMVAAPCSLSSANFGSTSVDCLPTPNLTITAAVQTR
jgi:cyclophilin family peptidyl-prolyl cis-trans isomerase